MGISLERLPEELGHIRMLLRDRKLDEALDYIREIKLDLLARLLLQGPDVIPPSEIENPPPAGPLPDAVLSAIDNQVAQGISPSKRSKPHA